MTFSSYSLDTFVAQGLSGLTECGAPDLAKEFDQAEHWVNNFILNSMLRVKVSSSAKPLVFVLLRRTQLAVAEYASGRAALLDYLRGPKQRVSPYFRALDHFEIAVGRLYEAFEMVRKLAREDNYQKNDGSAIERLGRISNVSKHVEFSSMLEDQLHPVWISNKGLEISTAELTWDELVELIREIGSIADSLSNPSLPEQDEEHG